MLKSAFYYLFAAMMWCALASTSMAAPNGAKHATETDLIFVVCYSGLECYTIDDGQSCVSGLVNDTYFEIGC